eukprot:4253639-Alexandrium_andersonii.AAC.1
MTTPGLTASSARGLAGTFSELMRSQCVSPAIGPFGIALCAMRGCASETQLACAVGLHCAHAPAVHRARVA